MFSYWAGEGQLYSASPLLLVGPAFDIKIESTGFCKGCEVFTLLRTLLRASGSYRSPNEWKLNFVSTFFIRRDLIAKHGKGTYLRVQSSLSLYLTPVWGYIAMIKYSSPFEKASELIQKKIHVIYYVAPFTSPFTSSL